MMSREQTVEELKETEQSEEFPIWLEEKE